MQAYTCQDYALEIMETTITLDLINHLNLDDFNPGELFQNLINHAEHHGITLVDLETWDYQSFFSVIYQVMDRTRKGAA